MTYFCFTEGQVITVTGTGVGTSTDGRHNIHLMDPRTVAIVSRGDSYGLLISDCYLRYVSDLPKTAADPDMAITEWGRAGLIGKTQAAYGSNVYSVCSDPTRRGIYYMSTKTAICRSGLGDEPFSVLAGPISLPGNPLGPAGCVDGIGELARFSGVDGITISADGKTLFACDSHNNRVRAVDLKTQAVTTATRISSPAHCAFYRSTTAKSDSMLNANVLFLTSVGLGIYRFDTSLGNASLVCAAFHGG
jgi:hypothetical protein